MKKISVLIPCYNEEENVVPISEAVIKTLQKDLPEYDYELVFIDNDSQDHTRSLIRQLCDENPKIKAIFNARNFGQFNSPYYGMLQITGDCVIEMVADFQDPVELIPQYVHEWEKGYKIVIGIKTSSKENRLMYWLRGCYYKMMKKLSDVPVCMTGILSKCCGIWTIRPRSSEVSSRNSVSRSNRFPMSSQKGGRVRRKIIFTSFTMRQCSALLPIRRRDFVWRLFSEASVLSSAWWWLWSIWS